MTRKKTSLTILEVLLTCNARINDISRIKEHPKYKAMLNDVSILLVKGYSVDEHMNPLMVKYKSASKVPEAKTLAGENYNEMVLSNLVEVIYPKIPFNYAFIIATFPFGKEGANCNIIHNCDKKNLKNTLNTIAEQVGIKNKELNGSKIIVP